MNQLFNSASRAKLARSCRLTRHFAISTTLMATIAAYVFAWSKVATALTGDDSWSFGGLHEIITALRGGGTMYVLMMIVFAWMFMTHFFAKKAEIRALRRRVSELESGRAPIA